MGVSMLAHLNTDVTASHFMGDRRGGTRPEEGVQYEVAGIGGYMDNAIKQTFWLWRRKWYFTGEELHNF